MVHMSSTRISAGASNVKALTDFVSSLRRNDARGADAALAEIKLKANEFGRGYRKALLGMRTALFDKNVDSLIFKFIEGQVPTKHRKEILREFREKRNSPLATDSEKGFFSAWRDVLRILEATKKS